jgi:hypothetical protein
MEITKKISRDVLENVFVTALEGGSSHWYYLSDDAIKLIRDAVPKIEEPFMSIAVLKAILDHGVEVPINDNENHAYVLGYISTASMSERLQKLSEDEGLKWALDAEIDGNGDAESSDVVFQYLTMGEYIFG